MNTDKLGLGCMGMSDVYGPADDVESAATLCAAIDAGVTLLDTGDFYGMGHNEMLIRDALRGYSRDKVTLSVKFGAHRGPEGQFIGYDTRPSAVRTWVAYSLKRLGTDYIDIYRPARLDPAVPIEDTVGAIADLVRQGYVRQIGLSEVGAATIERAAKIHPIADVQIEYSLMSRGVEATILPTCRRLGIGLTAYGVLGRGLLSGHWSPDRPPAPRDIRFIRAPRFAAANLAHNLALVDRLRSVAAGLGATVSQVAIAWVASRGVEIRPLVGARRRAQLVEALGAATLNLSPGDLAAIEAAIPNGAAAGDRYDPAQMAHLDSERGQAGVH